MAARQPTDEELDRDWKPSGRRPQSTMARSFSAELMDIFRIENSLSDLDNQVDQRKQTVNRNTQELASLEARIREMESRLSARNGGSSSSSSRKTESAINTATAANDSNSNKAPSQRSRPGTAKAAERAPSSGNMPPTPGGSEDGDRD